MWAAQGQLPWRPRMRSTRATINETRGEVAELLASIPIDFGGGCSVSKATVLAYLLKSQKLKKSIDIGVYRGRSFFPQALAHARYTQGRVLGIDPYSSTEAMEHDHEELRAEIATFVGTTDFDLLYATVLAMRATFAVESGCELLRTTSADAAAAFAAGGERFGLIHVDGNHDAAAVARDVEHYLPLLDPDNGFLVLDDISWMSVKPAVDRVSRDLTLLYARVDLRNDYAVYWTGRSPRAKSRLRKQVALAAED